MARKDVQTIKFDCDWKCGNSYETHDWNDLRHGLPPEWEQVNKMSAGVATTSEYKGVPYVLCLSCWTIFKTFSSGGHTGKRIHEFIDAWRVSEAAIREATVKNMQDSKPINFGNNKVGYPPGHPWHEHEDCCK